MILENPLHWHGEHIAQLELTFVGFVLTFLKQHNLTLYSTHTINHVSTHKNADLMTICQTHMTLTQMHWSQLGWADNN